MNKSHTPDINATVSNAKICGRKSHVDLTFTLSVAKDVGFVVQLTETPDTINSDALDKVSLNFNIL